MSRSERGGERRHRRRQVLREMCGKREREGGGTRMETCKTGASLCASTLLFTPFMNKLLFWLATSLAVRGGLCLHLSLGQITPNPIYAIGINMITIYNFHNGVFSKRKIRMRLGRHSHNPNICHPSSE
jgi:hypothetical protein